MPLSGAGTSYSSDYGLTDLNQITPSNPVDSWSALFRESSQTTLGRSVWDRFRVDHPGSLGQSQQTMSVEDANQEYGLSIKPTQTNRISVDLAKELGRKAIQSQLDRSTVQQAQPDMIQALGVGVAASATDPIEGLLNIIPLGGALRGASTLARGVKLTGTARGLARAAMLAEKPFLGGAIEGVLSTAASSPFVAANSQALGREYDFDDALMDIAVGGVAGSLLQGLPSLFRNRRLGSSLEGLPVDKEAALSKASLDFSNGHPVTIEKSIDAQQAAAEVVRTRQEVIGEILKTREPQIETVPEPVGSDGVQTVYSNQASRTVEVPFDFDSVQPLPNSLRRAAPRYRDRVLTFDNDLDKALYIVGKQGKNLSKAHDQYLAYVKQQLPHLSEEQINKLAIDVRQDVVDRAKGGADAIERVSDKRIPARKKELNIKYRPVEEVPAEVINSPTFQKHGTDIEKRLLQFTEPDEFRATVGQHVENISLKMAKLADMFSLPKDDFLEVASDVATLQSELLSDVAHINELLPTDQQITGDVKLTSAGLFRKDSLKALGNKINALNEMALQPIDDVAKITGITKEFDRLRGELKHANQYMAQAQAKGGDSGKWQAKIAELTPQVQHAQNLLRGLGENPQAPELTLTTFLDSVGADLSPALEKLLADTPETGELPVYRVRNQIFDNVMRRLDATEQYIKGSEEFGAVTPSKFPENDQILADVRKELAELGDVVDIDKFHEELFERVNAEITAQKALGIFDEKSLKRFDAIEEQFKANVEKTEAVKKGAVQAQACALRGVSE